MCLLGNVPSMSLSWKDHGVGFVVPPFLEVWGERRLGSYS